MTRSGLSTLQRLVRTTVVMLILCFLCASLGCTRRFYRDRADREVAEVLGEKDVVPEWQIENFHVYPDDRARFADFSNPDRPLMPPDDPAAKLLTPNPQRHKRAADERFEGDGYLAMLAAWDQCNRDAALTIARPIDEPEEIRQLQPEPGAYVIDLEQSVELGLFNSREFQQRREDLYLAALPVTFERFGFAPQFFAMEEAIREYTGAGFPSGKGDRWRLNTSAGMTKLFSTGALLLFSYANRTVIELSGRTKSTSVSTINLDIVQPLLQGGGKAVTLEPLTQAERNLLYEIRDYARFRKEYFQYITGGGELVSLGGGFGAGRAASPGAVSLGAGNPARPQLTPSAAGRIDLSGPGIAFSEGYLPTVQKLGLVAIEDDNVRRLESVLKLFQAYAEGGEVEALQVGQVELTKLQAQSQLLQRRQDYGDGLDRFKQQLGLPPTLSIHLQPDEVKKILTQYKRYDQILNQFKAETDKLEAYYEKLLAEFFAAGEKLDTLKNPLGLRDLADQILSKSPLVRGAVRFPELVKLWRGLKETNLKELQEQESQLRAKMRAALDRKTDLAVTKIDPLEGKEQQGLLTPEEQLKLRQWNEESDKIDQAVQRYNAELAVIQLERNLRDYEQPWLKGAKIRDRIDVHNERFRRVRNAIIDVLGEASNERMDLLYGQWPELPDVPVDGVNLARDDLTQAEIELALEAVVRIALDNRLDLMNARAELVDAWRQVAVYANSLLGAFNVGYHMDSSTPPGQAKPFAFQPSQTRHQLFLNAELPLVRLAERNNYRAALIGYQRARRSLMAAEDQVAAQVRAEVRQLQTFARNWRIQKKSVDLQFKQVESSLEKFRAPQAPGAGQTAGNVAALTQQLLGAYRGLPQAQSTLLATWINYQIARQQLYLDLELLPLDPRGVWIDELSRRSIPHLEFAVP